MDEWIDLDNDLIDDIGGMLEEDLPEEIPLTMDEAKTLLLGLFILIVLVAIAATFFSL
jgi:hypothetical protein